MTRLNLLEWKRTKSPPFLIMGVLSFLGATISLSYKDDEDEGMGEGWEWDTYQDGKRTTLRTARPWCARTLKVDKFSFKSCKFESVSESPFRECGSPHLAQGRSNTLTSPSMLIFIYIFSPFQPLLLHHPQLTLLFPHISPTF